jgi:hypothetical protein
MVQLSGAAAGETIETRTPPSTPRPLKPVVRA